MDANQALSFVDSGSWVWFKHDELAWAPCKVIKGGRDLELENSETHERYVTTANQCYPMHESSLQSVPNMVELADLNEASILHNLRSRYTQGDMYEGVKCDVQMFTYIGPILVYINPYKTLPIFTPELVRTYYTPRSDLDEKLPPHPYEVVNNTYLHMRQTGNAQGMVISGESGAGKTEATKICLNFLATVAGSKGDDSPTQLLLDSSPIMESFGNAKTIRNNNSSRFGKYMEIHFKDEGARSIIVGGMIKKYLLEKSRIVWQAPNERNFHIFVEIFDLPAEQKAKYGLTRPEDYLYINQGGSIRADGWDDAEELGLVLQAFKRLGIQAEGVFDIVAAVLWNGQTEFLGRGQDTAVSFKDASVPKRVAELLGVDVTEFGKCLTSRKVKAGKDTVVSTLNFEQACVARDNIAKHVYSKLFDWIAAQINAGIARVTQGEKESSIGVLDIFGFECFVINSFEQLCINFTNEKLQYHFNEHIFMLEMEVYKREKLDVKAITFKDNQGCLDLIEKKRTGVMAMIEEEIYVPKGSDHSMLEKLHKQNYGYNDFYSKPTVKGGRGAQAGPGPNEAFIIKHYAGPVPYKVDGFLEKCKDRLPPDCEELLKMSKNTLVSAFFQDETGMATPKGGGRPQTLGGKFVGQMQDLYDMLNATEPHFIKCVKPNNVKRSVFDSNFTLYQLTYLGLLEVIRIRKSGYPVRFTDADFVKKYRVLETDPDKWPTSRELCTAHGMAGECSPGRHCHSTLSLSVIGCHSLGIYTVILLSLLSLSAKMTASPLARRVADRADDGLHARPDVLAPRGRARQSHRPAHPRAAGLDTRGAVAEGVGPQEERHPAAAEHSQGQRGSEDRGPAPAGVQGRT
jgi:myosin-7